MNKRSEKRHKRQTREQELASPLSQHDLKTPNQIPAAGGGNLHDRSGPSGSRVLYGEEQTARDMGSATRVDLKTKG